MVEVFRTNVKDAALAKKLIDQIRDAFGDYEANFDLEDGDKILRVKCETGAVQSSFLIDLLKDFGCYAEVLPDEPEQTNMESGTQYKTRRGA
jgi:hypothetical protein